jgi:2-dehydropantoate 2-reductase
MMKIAVIGAGAMGSVFGGLLAQAGNDVTLIDVWREAVDAINANGLAIEEPAGLRRRVAVRAVTTPTEAGPVELALVFVKCYHTEAAVRAALPILGPDSTVLTLQNGWGNAPRIAAIVGQERVLVGLTYHSASVLGPGTVLHGGKGMTFLGELDGATTTRLARIAETLRGAGFEVTTTTTILREIYAKLALNVCTLPTAALLRFYAPQLVQHDGTLELMRALLREVVAVAQAQSIALDEQERWDAITGLLGRLAPTAKGSMSQDVDRGRRTEIDVINGAVVDAGRRLGIATPYNDTMVWMVKALEETF